MVSIQSFDAETGLVYLRNRYYEPELGCFTQVDPAMAGNNWHGYCDGDPVN
ncbi:RHS repeat-associated core domain-containing protein, partial [Acidihalobacter prosperus]